MKIVIKILLGAISIIFLAIMGLFVWLKISSIEPNDNELIAKLEKNRPKFEELINMFRDDWGKGLRGVRKDWSNPRDPSTIGISDARMRTYRELIKALELQGGVHATYNPVSIKLVTHEVGISITGEWKGYAYMDVKPEPLVKDLDKYDPGHRHSYTVYRSLGDHWYLFYQYEN